MIAGVTPILSPSRYITAEGGLLLTTIDPVFSCLGGGGSFVSFSAGVGEVSSVFVLNSHVGHFG